MIDAVDGGRWAAAARGSDRSRRWPARLVTP